MIIHKCFKIPGRWVAFKLQIATKKREGYRVAGITNKIGSRHVLFLDYDIPRQLFIMKEVKDLQDRFNLGNAYFFRSGRGFHVIIPDLMNYKAVVRILEEATIEDAYINVPRKNNKVWVLRTTPKGDNKIIFIGVMPHDSTRPKSAPHLEYLQARGAPPDVIKGELLNSQYTGEALTYATYEA